MLYLAIYVLLKEYYKICWELLAKNAPNFQKKSAFDMIVIYIGVLTYPVKDSYERSLISLK